MKNSLVLIALLSSFTARAQVCRSVFETSVPANGFVANIAPITRAELHRKSIEPTMRKETRPLLPDKRAKGLIEEAKKPHRAGEYGPRLITDEIGETPDIDKPVWVTLPDGTRKAFFGLSGQQYLLVDSIDQLARGGTQRPSKIQLFNEHGFPYGEDYDKTGKRIPYALDSSTWDVSLVQAFDENGHPQLKVLAGAMANGGNGRPLRITQKNAAQTRRRVVFHDVQFVQTASGEWSLSARRPKSPFFNTVLRDGSWSRFEKDGTPIMIHSYGGGAVKLADGSSYVDSSGNIHWAGDGVIEVRKIIGAKTGEWTYAPYHSGMYMAKLDPTMTRATEAPHVVLNALKDNGTFFKEAERPGVGPLVEGGHIEPRVILKDGSTRAIESLNDLTAIRKQGLREYLVMVGSQGKYDRDYGSFQANAKPGTTNFKMVLNKDGELHNLTGEFNVLTYATGRPVIVYGESGQAYLMWHADARTDYSGRLVDLSRQIWMAPVRLSTFNGVETYEILDNTGLMDELRRYRARPLKEKMH